MHNNNSNNNNNNNDAKAKARNKNPPASRPGAVSVGSAEASRLDERIEEKRNSSHQSPVDSLHQLEQEVRIQKQRPAVEKASQPGATAVSATSTSSARLQEKQAQIGQLQNHSSSSTSRNSAKPETALKSVDERISAKIMQVDRQDGSRTDTRSELDRLEDRVAAKMSGETAGSSNRSELRGLEDMVALKQSRPQASLKDDRAYSNNNANDHSIETVVGFNVASSPSSAAADVNGEKTAVLSANAAAGDIKKDPSSGDGKKTGKEDNDHQDNLNGGCVKTRGGGLLDEEDLEYGAYDGTVDNEEGLAVAVPIADEEENGFLPAAVEYDPDAKPPIFQNRRFRLYACLALFIMIAVAAGVGLGIALSQDDGSGSTRAQYRKSLGLREKVEEVLGSSEQLEESTSPYRKALEWITLHDKLELAPEDPKFIQRYIMAYFYFATSEKQPWVSCNPPTEDEDATCTHMGYVTEGTYRPVDNKVRWLSDEDECDWVGVTCDVFQQVQEIILVAMDMTGTFPSGIEHLPSLQSLRVSRGELRGSIPSQISTMMHLHRFDAHFHRLSGVLPDEVWTARNLHRFNVRNNQIGGPIKPSITKLADATYLSLGDNLLTGIIPEEIAEMKSLGELWLNGLLVSGTIPTVFGELRNLRSLGLHENNIGGTIPSELGSIEALASLELQNNAALGGEIPPEIYLPSIRIMSLHTCNFTGTISANLGEMTALNLFSVQNNNLNGQIPADLSALTSLSAFQIHGNNLDGSMPQQLCDARDMVLATIEADCLVPPGGGEPEISCPDQCCTACCNDDECVSTNAENAD